MPDFITPETFECTKCGECCKPITKVSEEDIAQIEKLGFNREDFLDKDPFGNPGFVLKRKDGYCMFLKDNKDGTFNCTIWGNHPQVCKDYPFFEGVTKVKSCLPDDLVWYKNLNEFD